MLEDKHLKQVSVAKMQEFTEKLFMGTIQRLEHMELEDTESIVILILMSQIILDAARDIIGLEAVDIVKSFISERKKDNEILEEKEK